MSEPKICTICKKPITDDMVISMYFDGKTSGPFHQKCFRKRVKKMMKGIGK